MMIVGLWRASDIYLQNHVHGLSDSGPLKLSLSGCVHVEDVWSGVAEVRFVFHPSV